MNIVRKPSRTATKWTRTALAVLAVAGGVAGGVAAGQSSSSNKAAPGAQQEQGPGAARPRVAQVEKGGAAVTLEVSEPLFAVAAALNTCGYDTDLDKSMPVRRKVRDDIDAALAATETARASRDALCTYIRLHRISDSGQDIGQYVSLALYLSPPPELTPNVDETDLPPQAASVVNVLPLLRAFADEVHLDYIWRQHRAEYEAAVERVHDAMTAMILDTNIYLHQPVSSYDGRRFLVLLEPMLSPALTNARIYGSDYIIVTSPSVQTDEATPVRMDQIRHIYLHYVTEPLVYSRGSAMQRLTPIERAVQDAPLEFSYKNDIVALLDECLIKAIEARTYTIAEPRPKKPSTFVRADQSQYDALRAIYDRHTATERQALVARDEREGWVLTGYFYDELVKMERNGDGLRDEIAPMVYSIDVDRARRHASEVSFVREAPADPLRPKAAAPRRLSGMDQAELDLMTGKVDDAAALAEKALADPAADHGRATYVLARIDLMQGDPEKSMAGFEKTLTLTRDARTVAWSHIYLGRLYDAQNPPERARAVEQYKEALAHRDALPDTKLAAETGIKQPFALPRRAGQEAEDDEDFDPSGKAEKDAYKPQPK